MGRFESEFVQAGIRKGDANERQWKPTEKTKARGRIRYPRVASGRILSDLLQRISIRNAMRGKFHAACRFHQQNSRRASWTINRQNWKEKEILSNRLPEIIRKDRVSTKEGTCFQQLGCVLNKAHKLLSS